MGNAGKRSSKFPEGPDDWGLPHQRQAVCPGEWIVCLELAAGSGSSQQ